VAENSLNFLASRKPNKPHISEIKDFWWLSGIRNSWSFSVW